jgi:formylmethanofuran dehydrogenase subunit C
LAEIILKSKGCIDIMVEAEFIRPDIFAGKRREEIEGLPVWQGPCQLPLSEFFDVDVTGNGSPEETSILIDGDVSRVKRIGQGMKAGKIEILGSAGMHLGSEMAGGSILLRGDAGSWAGMEMKGGLLQITGNAGDHIGSAYRGSWRGMTGGKILIEGNTRSQIGGGLAGGQIIVNGDVENFCGIRQNGGTILVRGSAVRGLGAEMTGGIAIVCGKIHSFLPGFQESGIEENSMLSDIRLEGRFTKFAGDYAIGKNSKGLLYWKEG